LLFGRAFQVSILFFKGNQPIKIALLLEKKNTIWKAAHLMNRRVNFYFGVENIKSGKYFASEISRMMNYFLRW
jgi:hypothetical protein